MTGNMTPANAVAGYGPKDSKKTAGKGQKGEPKKDTSKAKRTQISILNALDTLRKRGIPYLEVLLVIAGEGRDTGHFNCVVEYSPGKFCTVINGVRNKANGLDDAIATFQEVAKRNETIYRGGKS